MNRLGGALHFAPATRRFSSLSVSTARTDGTACAGASVGGVPPPSRAEQPPPPWLRNDYGVGRIHVAFVTHPVCKKRGLLGVVVAGDDASASSGAQWAGSLDLSSLEASAYCAAVAEQHSEWTFPVKWPPNAASR